MLKIPTISKILPSLALSIALGLAILSQKGGDLFTQWSAFSLLSLLMLGYLRQSSLFFTLKRDKAFLSYLLFILWALLSGLTWSVSKASSLITIGVFLGGLFNYIIGYRFVIGLSHLLSKLYFRDKSPQRYFCKL